MSYCFFCYSACLPVLTKDKWGMELLVREMVPVTLISLTSLLWHSLEQRRFGMGLIWPGLVARPGGAYSLARAHWLTSSGCNQSFPHLQMHSTTNATFYLCSKRSKIRAFEYCFTASSRPSLPPSLSSLPGTYLAWNQNNPQDSLCKMWLTGYRQSEVELQCPLDLWMAGWCL